MEPVVVFEDEHASIVFGRKPLALGHLKIYPKQKVSALEELPAKVISHLFVLATRCASLLFDGLQAQGSNIIVHSGPSANVDDNICIDVIARAENDGMSFVWKGRAGDTNAIKQTATDISSKVVVYENPPAESKKDDVIRIDVDDSVQKLAADLAKRSRDDPSVEPEKSEPSEGDPIAKKDKDADTFDPKKNFLFYELMRMP